LSLDLFAVPAGARERNCLPKPVTEDVHLRKRPSDRGTPAENDHAVAEPPGWEAIATPFSGFCSRGVASTAGTAAVGVKHLALRGGFQRRSIASMPVAGANAGQDRALDLRSAH
jgi:hypothetical protein